MQIDFPSQSVPHLRTRAPRGDLRLVCRRQRDQLGLGGARLGRVCRLQRCQRLRMHGWLRGQLRFECLCVLLCERCAECGHVGGVLRGGGGQELGVRLVVLLGAQRQRGDLSE